MITYWDPFPLYKQLTLCASGRGGVAVYKSVRLACGRLGV